MAYPIHRKLVIAVASSALFDLKESRAVFVDKGEEIYWQYQRENKNEIFPKGVAFLFLKRFLNLNKVFRICRRQHSISSYSLWYQGFCLKNSARTSVAVWLNNQLKTCLKSW